MRKKLRRKCPICGYGIYGNRYHCRDKKHEYVYYEMDNVITSESVRIGKYHISYMYKYQEMVIQWYDENICKTIERCFPITDNVFYPQSINGLSDIQNFLLMC